jgi:hypothetical protein
MARISVENGGPDLLALYVEPPANDYWLRPGDSFTVVAPAPEPHGPHAVRLTDEVRDAAATGDAPFSITRFRDGGYEAVQVSVDVLGSYTVIGPDGAELECGHQRPVS